jgi:hypothetical protein
VPRTEVQARKIAEKGRKLLERYRKKKSWPAAGQDN